MTTNRQPKALIALEDGSTFDGRAFAGFTSAEPVPGELVFNTSMTGYQEILTDPSYAGQIVTLTYPLIGNYGVNKADEESYKPHCQALIIGECSRIPSNWRSEEPLPAYLDRNGIPGIDRVDTRAVTLHIRSKGAMKCVLASEANGPLNADDLVDQAKASRGLVGVDLATGVSTEKTLEWAKPETTRYKIAALDCGVKWNQLHLLKDLGCEVFLLPASTPAADILALGVDGFFISNGPGDPDAVPAIVETLREVISTRIPTFGICFGHQLLGLALGGSTYKLKFGHRGGNQPVQNLATQRVEITSQNHGFCVDKDTFPSSVVDVSHINLNDGTCEGLRHKELPLFSVQYHPEAAPGPHDSEYLFTDFLNLIESQKS